MTRRKQVAIAGVLAMLAACTTTPPPEAKKEPPKEVPAPAAKAPNPKGTPELFKVRFDTSKGPMVIEVHRDWAPIGVDRFHELVKDGFFTEARFFRTVPNFVIQFGLAADPAMTKKWDKQIDDDPVKRTNRPGSLSFATAGPNTRTSQIFINLRSNQSLDDQGFAPFAQIVEGQEVLDKIYMGYGQNADQGRITSQGNAYLKASFPQMDYIRKATILP